MIAPSLTQMFAIPARISCRTEDLRAIRERLIGYERDTKDDAVAEILGRAVEEVHVAIRTLEKAHNIAMLNASNAWIEATEKKETV